MYFWVSVYLRPLCFFEVVLDTLELIVMSFLFSSSSITTFLDGCLLTGQILGDVAEGAISCLGLIEANYLLSIFASRFFLISLDVFVLSAAIYNERSL